MTRKFSEDETFKLVQLYREHECLWNIRSDLYKNKQARTSALQKIQEEISIEGLTIEEIKNKIKSIRGTYYLEVDKIEKSTRSGAGGNVYVPKVKWFDELNSFIKNVAIRRTTTNNTENTNDDVESENSDHPAPASPGSIATPRSENEFTVKERRTTPSLRSKRSKLSQMASIVNDLKNIDENMAVTEETEHDFFGKSVAAQLKKLSEEQAIIAQEKIQTILTQCRLADIRAKNATQYPQWDSTKGIIRTQYQQPRYQQPNYQPVFYSPPPEVSPSGTSTSSNVHHNENSNFSPSSYHNDAFNENTTSNSDIITIAFDNA